MKALFSIKYFLIMGVLMTSSFSYLTYTKVGGDTSDNIKNVDVKSIRQNPGSFRSRYMPFFIYTGGK